jgi:hypothetical protein
MSATRPRFLFVYFTVSQLTPRVVEAVTDTLRKRGCDVQHARIEFTDPRYPDRFSRFPFRQPHLLVAGMLYRSFGTRPDRYASRTRCKKLTTTSSASGRRRGG